MKKFYLTVLDSSSVIPSGTLMGNSFHEGLFDECTSINKTLKNRQIRGRYCTYTIGLALKKEALTLDANLTLSICVPSTCESQQIEEFLDHFPGGKLKDYEKFEDFNMTVRSARCSLIDSCDIWNFKSIIFL